MPSESMLQETEWTHTQKGLLCNIQRRKNGLAWSFQVRACMNPPRLCFRSMNGTIEVTHHVRRRTINGCNGSYYQEAKCKKVS